MMPIAILFYGPTALLCVLWNIKFFEFPNPDELKTLHLFLVIPTTPTTPHQRTNYCLEAKD